MDDYLDSTNINTPAHNINNVSSNELKQRLHNKLNMCRLQNNKKYKDNLMSNLFNNININGTDAKSTKNEPIVEPVIETNTDTNTDINIDNLNIKTSKKTLKNNKRHKKTNKK